MATIPLPDQETQLLTKFLNQTKKTLVVLSYKDITYESVKLLLNMLARYEPNQGSHSLSIKYAQDVTTKFFSVTAAIKDLKYRVSPNKPVVWLQKFIKASNVYYTKESYREGIKYKQNKSTDVQLGH